MTEWFENLSAVVLGGVITFLGVWWANREALKREELARIALRDAERKVRLEDFQHSNLLALQETILEVARMTVQANYEDIINVRAGKQWKSNALSEPLNSDLAASRRKLGMLISRVQSDELRSDLRRLVEMSAEITIAKDQDRAHSLVDEMSFLVTHLNEVVGAKARAIAA